MPQKHPPFIRAFRNYRDVSVFPFPVVPLVVVDLVISVVVGIVAVHGIRGIVHQILCSIHHIIGDILGGVSTSSTASSRCFRHRFHCCHPCPRHCWYHWSDCHCRCFRIPPQGRVNTRRQPVRNNFHFFIIFYSPFLCSVLV